MIDETLIQQIASELQTELSKVINAGARPTLTEAGEGEIIACVQRALEPYRDLMRGGRFIVSAEPSDEDEAQAAERRRQRISRPICIWWEAFDAEEEVTRTDD